MEGSSESTASAHAVACSSKKERNKIRPSFITTENKREGEMGSFGEKALKVSQALLAWLGLLVLSPILILVFVPLAIWKGVVWVVVKIFKRKFIKGLSSCESVFAVDRFWENSRSSIGLIVELEGAVDIEAFREEFRKNVLDFSSCPVPQETTDSSEAPPYSEPQPSGPTTDSEIPSAPSPESDSCTKPFAKLTQIPVTFCGYYYWQKANYFLLHEHIRQINQPTDELGLKKAASTLMSLPFPNRRPLWEILVYPNYLGTTTTGRGTTCGSALFIRIHRSVTDSKGLMNMLGRMLIKPDTYHSDAEQSPQQSENASTISPFKRVCNLLLEKFINLVFLPLRTFQFIYRLIRVPDGVAKVSEEDQCDSSNASWTTLPDILIRKICSSQTQVSRASVDLSLFLEGMTSRSKHKCLNVPEEKGTPSQQGKCQICVLIPVPSEDSKDLNAKAPELLKNTKGFVTVKCNCAGALQSATNKTNILKSIQSQVEKNGVDNASQARVVKIWLGLLSLLPRQVLRYLIMSTKWGAGCFIYEQFQMQFEGSGGEKEEKKLFGQYKIGQVVPLVGLQWTHTLASSATLQWQDGSVVISLIANAAILGPISQGNPQDHVERIVKGFPEELEKLSDDAEDHGFVSISIQ